MSDEKLATARRLLNAFETAQTKEPSPAGVPPELIVNFLEHLGWQYVGPVVS